MNNACACRQGRQAFAAPTDSSPPVAMLREYFRAGSQLRRTFAWTGLLIFLGHQCFRAWLKYAINSIPPFADFLKAAEQVKGPLTPTAEGSIESPLSMRTITNTVIDLIKFVTKTDNLDPMTREGIPIEQRQLMLSDCRRVIGSYYYGCSSSDLSNYFLPI